ncbi:hypothetical protein SAMN04489802_2831 [Pseudomonas chlororaphis]|uniref:DUF2280 domain-containing protein n=1 Tax=Pseudomonas chlororaphis TaxID=587753 RepID=UPI00087B0C54|nr:DUF2280 domain-containing protein [Pseudomonas chlororaphis]AZD67582.1 Phage protein [Pseudomonas chlororaphis subsp. aurantiaca]QIT23552.1 DUF2280 domain-containing protein [Pseudomonas chlororaphis subsp. aurantiaca]WDH01645.1 DUF2280 domain-containing protein [Pseudomonas chlororaphis]WDH09507.1 DUF2280 domain-containing protein [Pseudomonas chlororaphis]SDS98388.1 hypothetical protein SAMN04489802_2831 [Pseudomonas chlororaphis]
MAALQNDVKAFIVQALACFDTPSQVVEAVQKEYGLTVTRQQVETHDPTKTSGKGLAAKWQTLFHDTRKRFREETAEIPIANRAYRLRAMNRFVERAEGMKNISLAMQILEQAAKECGDVYVNRQRKDEPDDEPAIPTRIQVDVVDARKPNAEP